MRCQGEGTVHLNGKLDEVLISLRQVVKNQNAIFKRLDIFSPKLSPGIISFPCVAVMDAMGREHQIPLNLCFSYEACSLDRIFRRRADHCYSRRFLRPFNCVYPVTIIPLRIQNF